MLNYLATITQQGDQTLIFFIFVSKSQILLQANTEGLLSDRHMY